MADNRRIAGLFVLALLVFISACTFGPTGEKGNRGAGVEQDPLAELEALATPPGADPAVFAALKDSLKAMILAGPGKQSSALGSAHVKDLKVLAASNGGAFLLWSYNNKGDYDQNGEIAVSDLTPLGAHFGKSSSSPDWANASVADGDGNGEVNLSDLTPIGAGLGSSVEGYRLYYKSPTAGSYAELSDVPLSEANALEGTKRLGFEFDAGSQAPGTAFAIAPFSGTTEGARCEDVVLEAAAPGIASVSPLGGKVGAALSLKAVITGSIPDSYAWTFEGLNPATSSDESPSVTLPSAGSFACSLTVSNQFGSGSLDFSLSASANSSPTAKLSVGPVGDTKPGVYRLDASASTDADGAIASYDWDFDGDSNWDVLLATTPTVEHAYGEGSHLAQVRVTDADGAQATAAVSFNGTDPNQAPVPQLSLSVSSLAALDRVRLDAAQSSDPDGSIAKFEWDPYGTGAWTAPGTIQTLELQYDAPPGTYRAAVRVTDDKGATAIAEADITVTSASFVPVPADSFNGSVGAGGGPAQAWLRSLYKPIGDYRDGNGPYQTAYFAWWASRTLTLVNAERAKLGLAALKPDVHLALVIQAHVRDCALNNFFDHTNQLGMDPGDRIDATNPPLWGWWAENLNGGAGWDNVNALLVQNGPEEVVADWMASEKHRANILDPRYEYVGVGLYYLPSGPHRCFWGLLFGGDPYDDIVANDYLEPWEVQ